MLSSNTILENIAAPIQQLLGMGLNAAPADINIYVRNHFGIQKGEGLSTRLHTEDYIDLDAHAIQLLRDRSYSFVFLHLPVPHPTGIYNRHTGRFATAASSHINNLALADRCIAGIRQTLQETGQRDSAAIVVMGDHSWRTKQIWYHPTPGDGWLEEDQLASHGGQYDPRPVYIVKLTGQIAAARVDAPSAQRIPANFLTPSWPTGSTPRSN
jgi:hypothetical protein